jgi:hypothetical protein
MFLVLLWGWCWGRICQLSNTGSPNTLYPLKYSGRPPHSVLDSLGGNRLICSFAIGRWMDCGGFTKTVMLWVLVNILKPWRMFQWNKGKSTKTGVLLSYISHLFAEHKLWYKIHIGMEMKIRFHSFIYGTAKLFIWHSWIIYMAQLNHLYGSAESFKLWEAFLFIYYNMSQ